MAVEALTATSSEQQLARIMASYGPYIAIGRPGEELPELGAARMYVSHEDWQLVANDLISHAQAVVLQAGETPGLQWEMQTVRECLRPEQVLLFVPFRLTGSKKRREAQWARFYDWGKRIIPDLPKVIGTACFLYCVSDPPWTAHVFFPKTPPINHPLTPMLVQLGNDSAFKPRESFRMES